MRRRRAMVVGLLLCAPLLAGCHVEGTIDARSATEFALDVTATGPDVTCGGAEGNERITVHAGQDSAGVPTCRITGKLPWESLGFGDLAVSDVGEYRVLGVTIPGNHSDWPDGQLTIRFGGTVVSSTYGSVSGDTVRLDDLAALDDNATIQVVALNRPGPPTWVLAGAGGVAVGLAGTLLLAALGRNRRARRSAGAPRELVPEPGHDDTFPGT